MKNTFLFLFATLFIFSCSSDSDLTKIVPKEIDTFAREFIVNVHSSNIDYCLQKVDKEMQTEEGKTFLSNVANGISSLKLDSVKLTTARFTKFYGDVPVINYSIEYEQELDGYSIFFIFAIRAEDNNISVTGFDARKVEASLKEIHSFSLINKPIQNYLFLILAILSVGFVIFSLISVIRTPLKRKWLWVIGVLITFIKFKVNWSTGVFAFQLLSFQFLGAGLTKAGPYAPWTLTFSLPIIAIIYWVKRNKNEFDSDKKLEEKIITGA